MLYALLGNWNVIFAATIFWTDAFVMNCPGACECTGFDIYSVTCPKNVPQVSMELENLTDYSYIEMKCINPKLDNEAIDYCSISTILNKMLLKADIENVRKFSFESVSQNRTDIVISRNAFKSIPNLEILTISYNSNVTFESDFLSKTPNITRLDLIRSGVSKIDDYFAYVSKLKYLTLSENKICSLPNKVFENLSLLTSLHLHGNNISSLSTYAFSGLRMLEILDLSRNQIQELTEDNKPGSLMHLSLEPESLFRYLYELTTLDLSKNKLKLLPDNLFVSNPKLTYLYLNNNQLSVINKYLFRKLDSLRELDLRNNKIYFIESEAFRWQSVSLVYLYLSHNKWNPNSANNCLTYCESLQELHLSHNEIQILPYMPAVKKLEIMDLSYNQIESFEVKYVIDALWSPTEYDLSNNRIKNITFCLDKPIGPKNFVDRKIVLNVIHNPIQCGCSIYDLVRYNNGEMQDLSDILDIQLTNTFCQGGHNNTLIKSLTPSDFECSVIQECPSTCECWSAHCNKALVIDCAFKNLTTYPEIYVEEPSHQYIILNLSGNLLTRGPFEQDSYGKVISLNLSSNRITEIDWIPAHTKELDLSNNSLENLNRAFIKILKKRFDLQWLGLRNNSWTCDCEASDFRDYLIENYYMVKLDEVYCENMDSPLVKISDLCKEVPYLSVLLPVFLTIFLCVAVTSTLYYRYQTEIKVYLFAKHMCLWFVTEEELDKDKIFDIFISYSHQDEDFIVEQLLPQLEQGENPFKVCIHIRDWIPGELIAHQIIWSVQNSRRTLIVLSNSFLESVWGKMEFRAAHTEALIEGRARVIVLLYGDIDENKVDDELKSYLKTNTYIKWGEKYFWNKLRYALPHLKTNES